MDDGRWTMDGSGSPPGGASHVESGRVRRPILRYHGGKWTLAPWIISHFPVHRVYVEPFGGGASVLLRKPRSYAEVYSDVNGEIVNLFRMVRDRGDELRELLLWTPFAREEYELSFLVADDPLEQARRTVVRSYMGFGSNSLQRKVCSGFRASSNRSGTTAAHDWANYPECIDAIVERLRGVVIEHRPALDIIAQQDTPETLHYLDPPYLHATRSYMVAGKRGYEHEMSDEDHRALCEAVLGLAGMVVISIYDCPLYREYFADWLWLNKETFADGARRRVESLIVSPNATKQPTLGI